MPGEQHRRYKRYLDDPEVEVPRQTIARWESDQLQYMEDERSIQDHESHADEEENVSDVEDPLHDINEEDEDNAVNNNLEQEENVSDVEDPLHDINEEDEDNAVNNNLEQEENASDVEDPLHDINEEDEDNAVNNNLEQDVANDDPQDGEDLIYPDAPITRSQSALSVMAFALRHSLSKVAVQDLLRLINIHLPEGSLPESVYLFNRNFEECKKSVKFHVFCKDCLSYLGLTEELYCAICDKHYSRKTAISEGCYFVYTSLRSQLKALMESASLSHFFLEEDASRDVTLTWNCDGVPAFQSGNGSVWPIQCSVDILPPELQKKHILVTALWFGSSKPQFSTFLKPFVQECKELAADGMSWCDPVSNSELTCKVYANTLTCDSVARCQLQGINQFNGYFGCSWCLHEGKRVAKGNGHIMAYPFIENPSPPARTHKSIQDECVKMVSGQAPSFGVRSVSPLLLLPQFNMVSSFPVDYMHAVCEGVVEKITNLWFDTTNHNEPWYIGNRINEIDKRISSIVPPDEITRLPRSPSQRAHWKASEFRSWLLFYCLPVLYGILPNVHLTHILLLVHAVWILLQESVSQTDLCFSHRILTEFVRQMEILYGESNMVYNVHLMLHLATSVQHWGPLWKTSCFPFKGYNRTIKSLYHGTRYIPSQIAQNFAISRLLTAKLDEIHPETRPEIITCIKDFLRGYPYAFRAQQFVCHTVKVMILGEPVDFPITEQFFEKMSNLLTGCLNNIVVQRYAKVILNGRKFCADGRTGRRSNSVVSYDEGHVGCVKDILVVRTNDRVEVVVVIKEFRVQPSGLPVHRQTGAHAGHIVRLMDYARERIVLKTVSSKIRKCVTAIIDDERYCMSLPNPIELD